MLEERNPTEGVDTMFDYQIGAFVEVIPLRNFCLNILLQYSTCLGILETFYFCFSICVRDSYSIFCCLLPFSNLYIMFRILHLKMWRDFGMYALCIVCEYLSSMMLTILKYLGS